MNLGAVLSAPTHKCPGCHGTQLRHSRWTREEQALLRLLLVPYRCVACNRRFFRFNNGTTALMRSAAVFLLVTVLIVSVIYLVNRDAKAPQSAAPLALSAAGKAVPEGSRGVASNAQSQFELGSRYLAGEGAPQDYAEALKWLEMAAGGGHARARYNLGVMYQTGFGVQRDDARAVQWFELAARQDLADAQYQLATLYKEGAGVPIDWVKSYAWAQIAAVRGHVGAVTLRNNLRQVMTSQQIQDGQQAARDWNPGSELPGATRPQTLSVSGR